MAFCKNCGKQIPDGTAGDLCDICSENGAKTGDIINDEPARNIAWLAYFGILFFIPIVVYPNSKFAKFHSNQGLVLLIAEIVISIAIGILCFVFGSIPFIGWLISALLRLAQSAAIIVYMILGIVNSVKGLEKELPIIGQFRLI